MFSDGIAGCLDNHAPLYTKVVKDDSDKPPPWIDGQYITERCKRRAFEKKYRISKSHCDWCNYQAQSTHCRNIFKQNQKGTHKKLVCRRNRVPGRIFSFYCLN